MYSDHLILCIGGTAVPVTLGTPKAIKKKIPFQDVESLVSELGLSQFKSKHLLQSLRKSGIQFEPYMEKKLDEKSKLLSDFYEVKQIPVEIKGEDGFRDLVYVSDLSQFFFVMNFRGQDPNETFIRVGIDSGIARIAD